MSLVAALYVDPRGPYPKLLGPEMCWDEQRDARTYAGPWPVVAHPPCGPWGRLRHMCTKQDGSLAMLAIAQVRRWGGVLEQPAACRDHDSAPAMSHNYKAWAAEVRAKIAAQDAKGSK